MIFPHLFEFGEGVEGFPGVGGQALLDPFHISLDRPGVFGFDWSDGMLVQVGRVVAEG